MNGDENLKIFLDLVEGKFNVSSAFGIGRRVFRILTLRLLPKVYDMEKPVGLLCSGITR